MQVSEDAEGVVSFQYRTQPDAPPDVPTIQKQMAIVAWQPGPNRIVQVPDLVRRSSCALNFKLHHVPRSLRLSYGASVCLERMGLVCNAGAWNNAYMGMNV